MKLVLASLLAAASFGAILQAPAWGASDSIGEARRAYRDTCSRYAPLAYCECQAAGMAQTLSPGDMTIAREEVRRTRGASLDPQAAGLTEIRAAQADVDNACAVYRGVDPAATTAPSAQAPGPIESAPTPGM